ncbi:MAG: sigma-54 interaction domain-containing protein [Terriglobales bacterium]
MPQTAANGLLNGSFESLPSDDIIFGSTPGMREIQRKLEKVANAQVPVLIQGESGTGKEIIARLIHLLSPWASGPFVKVNCPAIPGTLLESELFGYEKGAFTGAYGTKPGRVELAHRGSLFMDEISELEPALQAKLLQLLQDGQFCRIGSQEDTRVEVRFICATNRDLAKEIESGAFRQDLYYRINVVNLQLPPLRERRDDVPQLVDYFLEIYNQKFSRRARPLSGGVIQMLRKYHWPGNVRELENLMKRYVILDSEDAVSSELVMREETVLGGELEISGPISLKKVTRQAVREMERKIILKVLQEHNWNRKRTARALDISYRALLYKLRDAGLPSNRMRKDLHAAAD